MYLLKKKKVLEIFRAALVLISLNIFKVKQIYTEPSLSATHVFAYQENIPFPLAILCKPNNAISIPKTFSVLHSAPQCSTVQVYSPDKANYQENNQKRRELSSLHNHKTRSANHQISGCEGGHYQRHLPSAICHMTCQSCPLAFHFRLPTNEAANHSVLYSRACSTENKLFFFSK